ncbi:MAG: hypothetical protein LCH56_05890 [Proteobacteria bacterium]|nr:hypothetical protein [Pseudomonadota bacterium]
MLWAGAALLAGLGVVATQNIETLTNAKGWNGLLLAFAGLPFDGYANAVSESKWTYFMLGIAFGDGTMQGFRYWQSRQPTAGRRKPNYNLWMRRQTWTIREAAALLADFEPLRGVTTGDESNILELLWEAAQRNELLPAELYKDLKAGLHMTGPKSYDMKLDPGRVLAWAEDKGFNVRVLKAAKPAAPSERA